jgi:hypothetical protein
MFFEDQPVNVILAIIVASKAVEGQNATYFNVRYDITHRLDLHKNLNFLTLEDGTDRFSRNVGTELPLDAA